MLLIITPNPALDRTMVISHVQPGQVHRAERVVVVAGGKGLNVARAARSLGQDLCVCAPLGGCTGEYVAYLAAEEGFVGHWSRIATGETRTCILVVEPQGRDATVLNEQGPNLSPDDWSAFVDTVRTAAADATLATISGSLPPGVPPSGIGDLIRTLDATGCRVIVDTSGAPLQAALAAAPYAIKVNRDELAAALDCPIDDIAQSAQALTALRTWGISLVIVSLGAQGALACADAGICWVRPPEIELVSSVGSGDSLLAGLATALLRGDPFDEAMRLGVACGTADALTVGGGLIHQADVASLYDRTTVEWLASGH